MKKTINREPVVSGKFYPSDPVKLKNDLQDFFDKTRKPKTYKNIVAVISPHAGYLFSGEVAASAFNQINPQADFENIFIIAPSHHASFNGASIYNIGNYNTPLGEVVVNTDIADKLISTNPLFNFYGNAHKFEHSLEVQLPFIQFWLKKPFKIVPIIVGTQNNQSLKNISESLKPWFNNKNLFVISSDFSHFPNYNDAAQADKRVGDAILQKNTNSVLNAVEKNDKLRINNLSTSACGLSGILILMHLLENNAEIGIEKIKQMNSGDSIYGDHDRVVGYMSFTAFTKPLNNSSSFELTENEKSMLLQIARNEIREKLKLKNKTDLLKQGISESLKEKCGAFVTIHNGNELRGCIGRFVSNEPLYKLIQEMAVSSAFHDHRFSAIDKNEIDDIKIEISVLSPLKKITDIDEIIIGKHGIYIKQGFNTGTLLPQVAVNNNWGVNEFLGYCSKHKAGIGWDGWKTAEIFTYTANVFSE